MQGEGETVGEGDGASKRVGKEALGDVRSRRKDLGREKGRSVGEGVRCKYNNVGERRRVMKKRNILNSA